MPNETAARADAYIRQSSMWTRLRDVFRTRRPSDDEVDECQTIARCAIDRVLEAYHLQGEDAERAFELVKDYAECAALYAYAIARARAS